MQIRSIIPILMAATVAGGVIGCSSQSYDGAERAAVSGTVTLDGEPVPAGTVYLMPEAGAQNGRISGATIKDGTFNVRESRGPNLGNYNLSFEMTRPTGKFRSVDESGVPYDEIFQNLTPKSLARGRSKHTVEIRAGKNVFQFTATSDGELSISREK